MFSDANGKPIKRRYCIAENVEFDDSDLWEKPRPEYMAWDFPKMILSILLKEKSCIFTQIQNILRENNVPIDLGYVSRGLDELIKNNKIERKGKTFLLK